MRSLATAAGMILVNLIWRAIKVSIFAVLVTLVHAKSVPIGNVLAIAWWFYVVYSVVMFLFHAVVLTYAGFKGATE